MKKYYSYSVKDELSKYFPGDTVTEMRIRKEEYEEKDVDHITALAWAYADRHTLSIFAQNYFLKETVLFDDYIAYIVQNKTKSCAYLSFMHFADNIPFDLDAEYAHEICAQWESDGYDAVIMQNCIDLEKRDNGTFRFEIHNTNEKGLHMLRPVKVNDKYILVRDIGTFWLHAEALLYSAVTSGLTSEYEKLFKEDAVVARCMFRNEWEIANNNYDKAETIVSGLSNIRDYFGNMHRPFMAYIKRDKSSCYDLRMVSDNKYYILFVDYSNQISRIVEETINGTDDVIPVPAGQIPQALPMPAVAGVSPLDIETMYAYAIQITYSDGCVRNFYLHSFESSQVDDVVINGYRFDKHVLQSVRYIKDDHMDGVVFSNGYYIPSHILYYRGIAQMIPEKIDKVVFENDSLRLTGMYRTPLKTHNLWLRTYEPSDDACYGANDAQLDAAGNRLSDYSGYYIDNDDRARFFATQSESSHKMGYLKGDGTWLVPPIFDSCKDVKGDCCATAKIGDKQFLVNASGEIIPFDYSIDTDCFSEGLCEFSVKKHEGKVTYPEERYFDELSAGLWGFIDKSGKVVIEPQYVFTSGFGYIEKRAFVARIVNGETLWGLIDNNGNEVLPCIYPNLATHGGTAVNFQCEKGGKYGIMDSDGNILMEPRYDFILEYNSEHDLIAAGEGWDSCGIARRHDGKVIVPFEYEFIWFDEGGIECTRSDGHTDYYDYGGNRMPDDFDIFCWGRNGRLCVQKDNKYGVIDKNGAAILPCIFDGTVHIDYYERGYLVTGTKGKRGLSALDGIVILSEKFMDIVLEDEFVIASYCTKENRNVRDELFLLDGTMVFDDLYRSVRISRDSLTRETPFGLEHYRIERL